MKKSKIVGLTILVVILAVVGFGLAEANSSRQAAEIQAKATAEAQANAKAAEAIAQSEAVIRKTKEVAYSEAVRNGTNKVLSAINQMNSIIENYNPSKEQALADSVKDIAAKVVDVYTINPPTGYEHVQTLYKQGATTLTKSMIRFQVGLKLMDKTQLSKAVDEHGQANKDLKQAIDEMNSILTSHGISY